MGYRVSGILKLPDGSPANNAEIEFISRKNFSPLVQELKSNIRCGATGAYDVTLEYGEYAVVVYPGGTYPAAIGTIIIAADTVAGQDLPTLLQQAGWQPATPEYIQQIARWLAEANASASDALASELAAKASENNAKASELAAESDRAEVAVKSDSVDTKHADVVSKAAIVDTKTAQVIAAESVAVAAADTASQKAADAAGHEAVSLNAATRAENAALSMVGAIIDGGECDLSGGVYPQPVSASGTTYSTVWFVAVGGTVGGVAYDAGDQLRYTTANSGYYFKVDAKDDVYSVNGEKGAVTVTPEKIGAEVSGTALQLITQHEAKPSAHAISGVGGLQAELDSKFSPSNKPEITDVTGLGSALSEKYSPSNKPSATDIGAEPAGAVATEISAHEAKSSAHPISGVAGLRAELDALAGASGGISAINDRLVVVEGKVATLEQFKSTCLVNATGTGAPHETVVAQLPVKVGPSSGRLTLPNPFGNNTPVRVEVQTFLNNKWGVTGFIFYGGAGIGFYGGWVQGEGIIVQSGAYTASDSTTTGGTHGFTGGNITTPLPVRVFVTREDN
ncbi:MAG: prophage tail fiber N-terminal domain-containing protein [Aeromonadaceae bacterium]